MDDKLASGILIKQLQVGSKRLAWLTIYIGALTFLGLLLNIPILTQIVFSWPSMNPMTAFCFVLAGATLLRFHKFSSAGRDKITIACASIVLLIATFGLLDNIFQLTPILIGEIPSTESVLRPMSIAAALMTWCSGAALILLAFKKNNLAQLFALACLSLALVGLIGLFYGLHGKYSAMLFSTMALHTGIAASAFALGILFACPQRGIMKAFVTDAGSAVMRRLLPWVIVLTILIGWLRLKGEEAGFYTTEFGVALFAVAIILVFSVLTFGLVKKLNASEKSRLETAEALAKSRAELEAAQVKLARHATDLEEQVTGRTAELRETLAQLETFSYTVSHDLRSPLRAMQAFAHITLEEYGDRMDDAGRNYLKQIDTAAKRMDMLIQDVIAYNQVARDDLATGNLDTEKLVEEVIHQYPSIRAPHASFEIQRPLHKISANASAFVQTLSNLLTNAVKFVGAGQKASVKIWTEATGKMVRLFVQDNGIGMPRDALSKIFEPFQRAHSNAGYDGTGIGLAIVKKAVERMGGKIGVQSEVGKGSTFWIELPAAK